MEISPREPYREGPFVKIKSQKAKNQAFTEFKYLEKTNYIYGILNGCGLSAL